MNVDIGIHENGADDEVQYEGNGFDVPPARDGLR